MPKGKRGGKRLPNYKNAIIRQRKLRNYLLNPKKSNGKSDFFRSLGYNMKNSHRFERDIREGLKNNPAIAKIKNKYGHEVTAYEVNMELGIDKKAIVLTTWEKNHPETGKKDNPKEPFHLVTAYPAERKKKK